MAIVKIEIPAVLKSALPATLFGRVLAATPVVMAVVATMLAGLASSEMTRAQYDRSLGAQEQSKAGDQWSFFQAKRLRGNFERNTAELLQTLAEVHPFNPAELPAAADQGGALSTLLSAAGAAQAVGFLQRGEVPAIAPAPPGDPQVQAALDGLAHLATDAEMAGLLEPVSNAALDAALRAGRDQAEAFDAATRPVNAFVDQLGTLLPRLLPAAPASSPATGRSVLRDYTVARLRYTATRYEVEARLNQVIANLYELQVRKSNFSAERHHIRSQKLFFGMLAAQLGVIVSTFAMAARQRNLLWSLAAVAGVLAVLFTVYVYLYV
jgi:hypothetical protein